MEETFTTKKISKSRNSDDAFMRFKICINSIICENSDSYFDIIPKDRGEIWHEMDEAKKMVFDSDEKLFNHLELLEKLILELLMLRKNILSEKLHKRSIEDLNKRELEVLSVLSDVSVMEKPKKLFSHRSKILHITDQIDKRHNRIK